MFRLFSITLFILLPLQSIASNSYIVRLAVYNNINSLKKQLNKLSPALRKTVEIQKRGNQHVACSVHTKDKSKLQRLLPSYKKVFPDAFISEYQPTEANTKQTKSVKIVQASTTVLKETTPVPAKTTEVKETPSNTVYTEKKIVYTPYSRKIVDPAKSDIPLYDRFHQKTLYLCAYGAEEWSPNVLMHVAFFDKEVIYTPIRGDVSLRREVYTIDNNRLYISQKGLFDSEIYNTLDEITSDYYLISTWVEKTKVNTIRYYFDLDKAEAYLRTLK